MKPRKTRVALLVGGPSAEHDISLAGGKVVQKYLDKTRFDVIPINIDRKGRWPIAIERLPDVADVAFISMHGEYGEDGTLQEALRDLEIPYTWSDSMASALAINKPLAYRALRAHGIKVPDSEVVERHNVRHLDIDRVELPAIVRPTNKGPLSGVSLVRGVDDLKKAIDKAFTFDRSVMVENFIPGKELSCGVMDDGMGNVFPLPIIEEVVALSAIPDMHVGYNIGSHPRIAPSRLSSREAGIAQATAVRAHQVLGASGASKTRMILGEDGELYVVEINTIPAITELSFFPRAAAAHGISFSEMLERIIEAAFVRHQSLKQIK